MRISSGLAELVSVLRAGQANASRTNLRRLISSRIPSVVILLLAGSVSGTIEAQTPPEGRAPIPILWQFADIHVAVLGPNAVKIDWKPLAGANKYVVQRNGEQIGPEIQSDPAATAALSFTDNNAPANSTVTYVVIAQVPGTIHSIDGTAHTGELPHPSNAVTVVTPAPPPPPPPSVPMAGSSTSVPSSPPPWAGQCTRSSGGVIAVACTQDGQFKVELEVWIRNLLVFSSAGSELRIYGWSSHTGAFGLGGSGWAEFLVPPPGPVAIHNTFSGVVGASGAAIGTAVQNCGQGGQGFTPGLQGPTSQALRLQCYLWSAGAAVKIDLGSGSVSPTTIPQLEVKSVGATATVTINGETVSVGVAKTP
jgi:hypothetical protein